MSIEAGAAIAAMSYIAFLAVEKSWLGRARRRVGTVVHVNGTRGKSETTRLLAAALRAGGRRVLAKTTGTEPRIVMPDGSERRLRRLGAADVREQRNLLLLAARERADCLVAECMAVSPDAQAASDAFLSPDMLLVTNARPDHESELGPPDRAVEVFASLVPRGGIALTSDPKVMPALACEAERRGATAYLSQALDAAGVDAISENVGLALMAAELLGVPRETAVAGMRGHAPDPGAFALRELEADSGGLVLVIDALAANDPESAESLFARAPEPASGKPVLLIATRPDRPDRSLAFARWAAGRADTYGSVAIVGPLGLSAARCLGRGLAKVPRGAALRYLRSLPAGAVVHATGNWKGLGPALAAADLRRGAPSAAAPTKGVRPVEASCDARRAPPGGAAGGGAA